MLRHTAVLLNVLRRYARIGDKMELVRVIAGIRKYARAPVSAAELIGIPAAQTLSDKDEIFAVYHCSKLSEHLGRGILLVHHLRGYYILRRDYPAERLVILVVGYPQKAVQVQYLHALTSYDWLYYAAKCFFNAQKYPP